MTDRVDPNSFVNSEGNVFADMKLDDADELLLCSQLGYLVRHFIPCGM